MYVSARRSPCVETTKMMRETFHIDWNFEPKFGICYLIYHLILLNSITLHFRTVVHFVVVIHVFIYTLRVRIHWYREGISYTCRRMVHFFHGVYIKDFFLKLLHLWLKHPHYRLCLSSQLLSEEEGEHGIFGCC